jgi:SAM-dependent methyltransferase
MEKLAKQAGKPTGKFGILFARSMNKGHIPLTMWGLRHVVINKNDVILDIGCGGGKTVQTLATIATEGSIYGIDYSEVSVKVSTAFNRRIVDSGQVKIAHASVESLPFPDNMFDLVTAIETYYFWPDLINNLKEIRRVLKSKGALILINECYRDDRFEKRNSKWAQMGDFVYYLPEEFKAFLEDAGFFRIQIDVLEKNNWITAIGAKSND